MIKQKDLDLLADLAKLFRKYGPEAFESLQTLMASNELPGKIADFLAISKDLVEKKPFVTRARTSRSKKTSEISIIDQLSSLKEPQPSKYDILEQFYNQARAKQIIATREDAVKIAGELGIMIPKKASRVSTIAKIIQQLSSLPLEQLESQVKEIVERTKKVGTLQEWADIILKRGNNS